jgi:hypothetical protein
MAMSPFETRKPSGNPPMPKTKTRAVNIISELLLRNLIRVWEHWLRKLLGVIESKSCSGLLFFLVTLKKKVFEAASTTSQQPKPDADAKKQLPPQSAGSCCA